jgi:hypothetical protein
MVACCRASPFFIAERLREQPPNGRAMIEARPVEANLLPELAFLGLLGSPFEVAQDALEAPLVGIVILPLSEIADMSLVP